MPGISDTTRATLALQASWTVPAVPPWSAAFSRELGRVTIEWLGKEGRRAAEEFRRLREKARQAQDELERVRREREGGKKD